MDAYLSKKARAFIKKIGGPGELTRLVIASNKKRRAKKAGNVCFECDGSGQASEKSKEIESKALTEVKLLKIELSSACAKASSFERLAISGGEIHKKLVREIAAANLLLKQRDETQVRMANLMEGAQQAREEAIEKANKAEKELRWRYDDWRDAGPHDTGPYHHEVEKISAEEAVAVLTAKVSQLEISSNLWEQGAAALGNELEKCKAELQTQQEENVRLEAEFNSLNWAAAEVERLGYLDEECENWRKQCKQLQEALAKALSVAMCSDFDEDAWNEANEILMIHKRKWLTDL